MNINEALRHQTLSVRDELAGYDRRIAEADAQCRAGEERVKRAGTEITRQRTLEAERKRALNVTAEKVSEAQRVLDELEQKRREALEALICVQDELSSVERSRREAQAATEAALVEVRKEQKAKEDAESQLETLRARRKECEASLRRALLKGLEVYLEQQVAIVQAAFSTQEQRSKAMEELAAFKKARHTDAEIARLCDERDEIRKLLRNAMVPGVKDILQASLEETEEALSKRFPIALHMPDAAPRDNQIEELLFHCDREGRAIFLLPISPGEWNALGEGTSPDPMPKSMSLVWSMIRELGLRTSHGDFTIVNGKPAFLSEFDLETVASQGFSVKCEADEVIRFVLVPVPTELQEALLYEDQDN
jgi:hypothetical protein